MMRRSNRLVVCLLLALGCDDGEPRRGDGGTDADELDCPGLVACAEACSTEACVQGCVDDASRAAIEAVTAVLDCVETYGCGDDDACVAEHCGEAIAACGVDFDPGEIEVPPPDDDYPTRVTGTLRDLNATGGITNDAIGTVTFVRDDAAGPAAGFPTDVLAVYRIETITYRATRSGTIYPCTHSADETETFENPPLVANYLTIEREADASGGHVYSVGTGLAVDHADALSITCEPPFESSTESFEAALIVSSRPETPTTDLLTFQGSKNIGGRVISWDLHAAD